MILTRILLVLALSLSLLSIFRVPLKSQTAREWFDLYHTTNLNHFWRNISVTLTWFLFGLVYDRTNSYLFGILTKDCTICYYCSFSITFEAWDLILINCLPFSICQVFLPGLISITELLSVFLYFVSHYWINHWCYKTLMGLFCGMTEFSSEYGLSILLWRTGDIAIKFH